MRKTKIRLLTEQEYHAFTQPKPLSQADHQTQTAYNQIKIKSLEKLLQTIHSSFQLKQEDLRLLSFEKQTTQEFQTEVNKYVDLVQSLKLNKKLDYETLQLGAYETNHKHSLEKNYKVQKKINQTVNNCNLINIDSEDEGEEILPGKTPSEQKVLPYKSLHKERDDFQFIVVRETEEVKLRVNDRTMNLNEIDIEKLHEIVDQEIKF